MYQCDFGYNPNYSRNTQTLEDKARTRDVPYLDLSKDTPKSKGLREKLLNEVLGFGGSISGQLCYLRVLRWKLRFLENWDLNIEFENRVKVDIKPFDKFQLRLNIWNLVDASNVNVSVKIKFCLTRWLTILQSIMYT